MYYTMTCINCTYNITCNTYKDSWSCTSSTTESSRRQTKSKLTCIIYACTIHVYCIMCTYNITYNTYKDCLSCTSNTTERSRRQMKSKLKELYTWKSTLAQRLVSTLLNDEFVLKVSLNPVKWWVCIKISEFDPLEAKSFC